MKDKEYDDLNEIAWTNFSDAYGTASEVPRLLRMLTSLHEGERQEAVDDLLFSRAYHQFELFTVTPLVIKFVISLLDDPSSSNLPIHKHTKLADEIVAFCRACSEGRPHSVSIHRKVVEALSDGVAVVRKWTRATNRQTAEDAAKLVQYVQNNKGENINTP